jgi:hypothetical protein
MKTTFAVLLTGALTGLSVCLLLNGCGLAAISFGTLAWFAHQWASSCMEAGHKAWCERHGLTHRPEDK